MILKLSNKNLKMPDAVEGQDVFGRCLDQASVDVFVCLCRYELDVDSSRNWVFA